MFSPKNDRSQELLLPVLESKRYPLLDTIRNDMTKSRVKLNKTNIFTAGISSYSRNQEYIIYERKKAFIPPGNLLPGIKVSRDKRFNITLTKQPDKRTSTQLGISLLKSDITEPTTKLPRIFGKMKINRDLEPQSYSVPEIEFETVKDEEKDKREEVTAKDSEHNNTETLDEDINSVDLVKKGSRKKKHTYLKKKKKMMKVPLFQSMMVTPNRKKITLSCTLTYDIGNGEGLDIGEVKETKAIGNKLVPTIHQQVSPKDSSSSKTRQKSYQTSQAGDLLACSGSNTFNKNCESTNPVKNITERYVAKFGVPSNPPPSACAELFGLPLKGIIQ